MLKSLYICNYALIDNVTIDFNDGFSTITGETGAGKSVLLGAIALVLGERADTKFLLNKDIKCVIEAGFLCEDKFQNFFTENDLDFNTETIVRREISAQGKSRIFINDSPVSLQVLKQFGSMQIDLHTQFQKFSLSNSVNQLAFVDEYIEDKSKLNDYVAAYEQYITLNDKIRKLENDYKKLSADRDYVSFLFNELETAKLSENEDVIIEDELKVLDNHELIKEKLSSATQIIAESSDYQESAVSLLNNVKNDLSTIADYIKNGDCFVNRLDSVIIELKDIASELYAIDDAVVADNARAEELRSRLDLINKLTYKHKVNDVNELIALYNNLSAKLVGTDDMLAEINSLQKEKEQLLNVLDKKSAALTSIRKRYAHIMENQIVDILKSLGIKNNKFVISINALDDFTPNGKDMMEFLFSANVGTEPASLSQVASGGELSRVMLALKSVIAIKNSIPTVIFDEIDSGISGVAAAAVAEKMKDISRNIQVIAITHLPQIAAKSDYQYLVYKETKAGQTYTRVEKLDFEDRVKSIAAMISGSSTGVEALNTARSLLTSN
ncbi:MAG: DNA repair protein RecN [Bacteroidales bacterium]|nr:DNA repair protein RecN [Bacteroidales bacterium]MDD2204917.1 DNA repair protein RecN [Bacteroidales bacterium]MDD3152025.1 DNA repair protein RecN [Bacteroidales bacterium]MDD3914540.1 DNA repair protein RecN [Bacteroidales bacterium]MDD4634434.1 DNA repair protein RecN [Bacteroidales bacterium]